MVCGSGHIVKWLLISIYLFCALLVVMLVNDLNWPMAIKFMLGLSVKIKEILVFV